MQRRTSSLLRDHRVWVELFALLNIAGLAADIYLAHQMNFFAHHAEYIPLGLSLGAPLLLVPALWMYARGRMFGWSVLGHLVGWACIAVGIAGAMYHLESSFFQSRTLKSLVYSAPFAAPLAYTGLGLLLIMNRMVDADDPDWPLWVILLALGGYIGNFAFSVTDHAQNGFFYEVEWVSVAAGAFGVAFLILPFVRRLTRFEIGMCMLVMVAGALVGLLGFYLHVAAGLDERDVALMTRLIYGAPVFAPLLFVDMTILALIGLAVLYAGTPRDVPATTGEAARGRTSAAGN